MQKMDTTYILYDWERKDAPTHSNPHFSNQIDNQGPLGNMKGEPTIKSFGRKVSGTPTPELKMGLSSFTRFLFFHLIRGPLSAKSSHGLLLSGSTLTVPC